MRRIYSRVVRNKLEEAIEGKIGENQAGFTAGKSCIDHIYTVKQLPEKKRAKNKNMHIAFIDVRKACDSVPRAEIWKAMQDMGIKRNLIQAIKNLYNQNEISIKMRKRIIGNIKTTKELLQPPFFAKLRR
ncbi:hypothetical protein ILUMI_15657 [Ignelater luminosus]|uniref:Reverse transcriptase domain-containing protein n=1 Tax=Ignelater luminosus TaxID=2038154 RepID=A0A8K0CSL8_IGNLU|nr:hypothetical protein ILUMI_15657 [Ignelater luminosus]